MYDPLGILNDTKTTNGKQQVDPLGILPKKKEVGGTSSQSGGQVGTSVPPSEDLKNDPVKAMIAPARDDYKNANENYFNILGSQSHGDIQGMRQPVLQTLPEAKQQVNTPSPVTVAKQQHNKAANNLVNTIQTVKQNFFKNGAEAKDALSKLPNDPNNETTQLAQQKSDEYDKVYNDYQKFHSIAASAINEAMENDPNFAAQVKQSNGKLPPVVEGAVTSAYINNHKNDLEALSEKDKSIGADYEDLRDNLEQKIPEYGMNVIANKLSQEREKQGYNSSIANFNTSTFRKHNDELASKILTPQEQELYKKNKEQIDGMIDTGGALNRAESSIEGGFKNTKDLLQTSFGFLGNPQEKAYNNLQDQFSGVSSGEKGWKQAIGNIGSFGGTLAYMGAGGEILGGLGVPEKIASRAMIPATFGEDFLKQGEEKYPDDPAKAKLSGWANILAMSALPDIFPAGKIKEAFQSIKPEIEDAVSKVGDDENALSVRNKISDAFQKGLTQIGKGSGEMGGLTVFNQKLDQALGLDDKTYQKFHPDTEVGDVVKQMAIANILPAIGIAGGELLNKSNIQSNGKETANAETQAKGILNPQQEGVENAPSLPISQPEAEKINPDELFNEKMPLNVKYKTVNVKDLFSDENKTMSASKGRRLMEKQHNILEKLVNCLT